MKRRPLSLDDLPRFVSVQEPRISPEGQSVAYVVESIDLAANGTRSAIWLAPFDGGVPRQLTAGLKRDTTPRWSPDGRRLAFVSDRDGKRQIYVMPVDGGDPVRLTDHPVGAGGFQWSPEGTRIAYLADGADRRGEPVPLWEKDGRKRTLRITGHRHKHDGRGFRGPAGAHLWLVDVPAAFAPDHTPNTGQQLTEGPYDDNAPAWSPDGRTIAFVSDRSADRDRHFEGGAVHLVDVASGAVRRLTPEEGRAANPSWSPDGKLIAYIGALTADEANPSDLRLFVISADGGEPRDLSASFGRSVGLRPGGYLTPSRPVWDGDSLLYLANTGGSSHLWRFGVQPEQLSRGRHATYEATFSDDRSRAALLVADARGPAEVWGWRADRGLRQLSNHNAPLLAELDLPAPQRHTFKGADGQPFQGWLLAPHGEGPFPLVLSVHGGPHNLFGDTWNFDHQLYAGQGYAVLYVNPRGSGGYGEAFAGQVVADWGGGDWQDQLAALDAAIASSDPAIDPRRLAITGSSYGGFMTCWAVGQTDRFATAVAGACISNLTSFFGTSDIGATWGMREFGGPPHERLDWYLAHSPIRHVHKVTTPLLLYHGESDLRCPIEQSEQMFSALHQLGKRVELLRLPGEPHAALSAGSPSHRIDARKAILEWLARGLAGGR